MQRLHRVGGFFLFIGAGSLLLYLLSNLTRMTDTRFLFWGVAFMGVGLLMRWMSPPPRRKKSTRFRLLRRDTDDEES